MQMITVINTHYVVLSRRHAGATTETCIFKAESVCHCMRWLQMCVENVLFLSPFFGCLSGTYLHKHNDHARPPSLTSIPAIPNPLGAVCGRLLIWKERSEALLPLHCCCRCVQRERGERGEREGFPLLLLLRQNVAALLVSLLFSGTNQMPSPHHTHSCQNNDSARGTHTTHAAVAAARCVIFSTSPTIIRRRE